MRRLDARCRHFSHYRAILRKWRNTTKGLDFAHRIRGRRFRISEGLRVVCTRGRDNEACNHRNSLTPYWLKCRESSWLYSRKRRQQLRHCDNQPRWIAELFSSTHCRRNSIHFFKKIGLLQVIIKCAIITDWKMAFYHNRVGLSGLKNVWCSVAVLEMRASTHIGILLDLARLRSFLLQVHLEHKSCPDVNDNSKHEFR